MAMYATNRFAGDGSTTSYEFNFVGKYIDRTHVKVYQEDNATKVRTYVSINDSNFLNDTTLRSLPVTPVGSTLVIYRETPKPPLVDFVNGSRFTEYNMDLVARQGLFVAMEAMDAGDAEARQQLLDAIAVIVGLSDDATAAALAAATSASTASTKADLAGGYAVSANTSASAASASASSAAGYAASINPDTFVKLAGTQTITGAKTFSIAPEVASVPNPATDAGKALNWSSIQPRTVLNGWGVQAGVTSHLVYMGWGGVPGGILAQVDASPMGSVLTTEAAKNLDGLGALVFGHYIVGGSVIGYGTQVAGSTLRVASVDNFAGGALSGTWVCLGTATGNASGTATSAKTLFMRVA